MLLFPDVQQKAQAAIDSVVGEQRMPDMEDIDDLQYIRGCMKEIMRWMPTTILGAVPHAVTKDDWYEGYRIPAGAGVVNNAYTINMDPKRFPDPRRFDPDRYSDDKQSFYDAANNPDVSKRDHFTFGGGRRLCPGLHVAERSLFLGISRLLWAFDIAPVDGEELPDPEKLTQGFVCMPEPYKAKIMPRSEGRAQIVRMEWEAAKEKLEPVTMQWREIPEGVGLPSL